MLSNQRAQAQGLSLRKDNSLAAKLEHTRAEVRRAITDVQASEGRFLDYAMADVIQRAMLSAARNLQELTVQVAVMERKARS
jgi:ribulose 1,5-bisphosphate synthetase/thiazole synthase